MVMAHWVDLCIDKLGELYPGLLMEHNEEKDRVECVDPWSPDAWWVNREVFEREDFQMLVLQRRVEAGRSGNGH